MNKVSITEENMSAKHPPQHRWYHDTTETGAEAIVITLWPYRSLSLRGFQIFIAVLASLMWYVFVWNKMRKHPPFQHLRDKLEEMGQPAKKKYLPTEEDFEEDKR